MRLKRFNEQVEDEMIYNNHFQDLLPPTLVVSKGGQKTIYKKGNVMKHSDMLQIVYSSDEWGIPGDLELDMYFVENGHLKIDIDVTYGDLMVWEFSLEQPNKYHLIQKVDDFKFEEESLKSLIPFFNQLDFSFTVKDLK
jgi:hypothetical protein